MLASQALCYSYPRWVAMEGSSDSAWQNSGVGSRGFDIPGVSERNFRSFHSERFDLLAESHQDFVGLRKAREQLVSASAENTRNALGYARDYGEEATVNPYFCALEWDDVSLRQWLDKPERLVDELKCLHIFMQIVEIVNEAHSQGVVVHNVRPSCFVMSSFNHVSFIESASCSDSGSDSLEDGLNSQTDAKDELSSLPDERPRRGRLRNEALQSGKAASNALSGSSGILSSSVCPTQGSLIGDSGKHKVSAGSNVEQADEKAQSFPMKQVLMMETGWYTSPEEAAGSPSSCASDIYCLGVLLFELLLKWPKKASFCLWLLHPEPSSRPVMSELLQSQFLNEPRDNLEEREAAIELKEKIEEQELLLEFLLLMQQKKQEIADKLLDTVSLLCMDVEEVSKQQKILKKKATQSLELGKNEHTDSGLLAQTSGDINDSTTMGSKKRVRPGLFIQGTEERFLDLDTSQASDHHSEKEESILSRNSRLMKNFSKLEAAYFLTRYRSVKSSGRSLARFSPLSSEGRSSVVMTERSSANNSAFKDQHGEIKRSGWIQPFLEGLCKYLSFSQLKVKADLKQGDLLNSSNLVCSLSFDRDGEFFATAGVNKKIKVFECDPILNQDRDIHYPVVEMASRSKLSSICWNTYIKSQIASSNLEGIVQVWDVTRCQVLTEMREHEKRVWSIDFSPADPTLLASGSDDGSVKLWSINQGVSIGTIKTKANVCSVQFPSDSCRSLAFGSADHRIYYYDLRNSKVPLCTLVGHQKTVSYVKFLDPATIVSASTDNTLKLWDLSGGISRVIETPLQSFTGHTNVKNFVGLSVSDGYIATGSETNEVFVYHKAFPMPALSFRFNSLDPLSSPEADDATQFISSVCWRGQSSTLVAANSTGNIKILEMA
ncbi:hypothetical protein MLD38_021995 [Melastoma candidum]|uniref:Uncharacterized protein n=1 Tax=Melastoma candidum TaxID=119954 RepID=A0ACB9QJM9_9MYRT|nr:hypothetical protein MLD38_021995 [Melastoma candidum]